MAEKDVTTAPSPNANLGRFAKGNKFSKGNPLGGKIEKLRARLVKAVTPGEFDAIAKMLITESKKGSIAHIHELFDRLFGKSRQDIHKHHDGSIRHVIEGEDRATALLDRIRQRFGPPGRN